MSSLLQEAIVDAKALRETALKNAEAAIVEKYSGEVRETLEQLLEQEDDLSSTDAPLKRDTPAAADLGAEGEEPEELAKNIPLAATDDLAKAKGSNLASLADGGEAQEFNVNLDALQEAISNLEAELNESEDEEIDLSESDLADILSEEEEEDYAMASSEDEDDDDRDDDDDDVAARTPPRDKKNKADFLPKDVRDKINKKTLKMKNLILTALLTPLPKNLPLIWALI